MQCLIYICELMEHCDVGKFFTAVSESKVTLESIFCRCVLDELVIKGLEGSSWYFVCCFYKILKLSAHTKWLFSLIPYSEQ